MIPIRDNLSCKSPARATQVLIILNVIAFAIEMLLPAGMSDWFFSTFCVVPGNITEAFATWNLAGIGMGLLSILTAMFLHGGVAHIFGNMIFLNAFGKSAENRLGSLRFVGFYLLGGFAAWFFHYILDPYSMVPALGASGAIAAVLGFYLLFYPKAEFLSLVMAGPVPVLVSIRAYWFLVAWFVGQIIPGLDELLKPSMGAGIAYWAHIGGFAAGLCLAAYWKMVRPVSDVCYSPFMCKCGHEDCVKNGVSLSSLFRRRNVDSSCEHGCDVSEDEVQADLEHGRCDGDNHAPNCDHQRDSKRDQKTDAASDQSKQ
ncbi:MAG: rhomboid family intramembrane serine protease [Candidatus Obscuribacterales bacterium]|nr:rhomboid family intramembrane serine protease [Candidatus Obscuribacterales bacterium]